MSKTRPGAEFRRILVVCTQQIGDVLLTTPLIRAAKRRWPNASIDVLGMAGTLGMLRGNTDIAQLIEAQPGAGWLKSLPLIWRLWRRYDLALVTQAGDRAHLYGWVAARTRSGLVPGQRHLSWWKRRLLDHAHVLRGEKVHSVVEKLLLLEPWMQSLPEAMEVVPPAPVDLPAELQAALQDRFVVVHAPSMWTYKQWPAQHFRSVVSALLADGVQVVLTGSGSKVDKAQVEAVKGVGSEPALLDVSGRLDLAQVGALLRRAALYIGPDTSITHLAAACGVPVVTVFGPTNPMVWGPWPQGSGVPQPYVRRAQDQLAGKVILLQGPGDCVPCSREGCERRLDSRSACLDGIEPRRVLEHARAILAQTPCVSDASGSVLPASASR